MDMAVPGNLGTGGARHSVRAISGETAARWLAMVAVCKDRRALDCPPNPADVPQL